jgi:very-short-patch-repair endonuclease
MVVEVDGSQHVEQQTYDDVRSRVLADSEFKVLRFWNNDVLNQTDAVVQNIWNVLNPSPPQPSP